jgi:hypothetical protein
LEILTWLENKNPSDIVTVIVGLCVIVAETTVLLKIFLPIWSGKKDSAKQANGKQPKIKNDHLVKIGKRLELIEASINRLVTGQEKLSSILISTRRKTLEYQVYNEKLTPYKRLRAFKHFIALGGNSNTKEDGVKIILQNRKLWQDVLNDENDNFEIIEKQYFKGVIEEIRRRIYE